MIDTDTNLPSTAHNFSKHTKYSLEFEMGFYSYKTILKLFIIRRPQRYGFAAFTAMLSETYFNLKVKG